MSAKDEENLNDDGKYDVEDVATAVQPADSAAGSDGTGNHSDKRPMGQQPASKAKKAKKSNSITNNPLPSAPIPAVASEEPTFHSFLINYCSFLTSRDINSMRKLFATCGTKDVICIARYWCRDDKQAAAPVNPLGLFNYVEAVGLADIVSYHTVFMALTDITTTLRERTRQSNGDITMAMAKVRVEGTVTAEVRAEPMPEGKPAADDPSDRNECPFENNAVHEHLRLRQRLFEQDCYAQARFCHRKSRRLVQAPEILAGLQRNFSSTGASSADGSDRFMDLHIKRELLQPVGAGAAAVDGQAGSANLVTSSSSGDCSDGERSSSIDQDGETELIQLPVLLNGLVICHYRAHDPKQVFRVELHYYDPKDKGEEAP